MKIVPAPRGLAIDTPCYVDPERARALYRAGFRVVWRYIRRREKVDKTPDQDHWCKYLSHQELDELLSIGLLVGLVQRGIGNGPWRTPAHGRQLGHAAASNAEALGIPAGASAACDCEWTRPPAPAQIRDYLYGWGAEAKAHTVPMLYHSQDLDCLGATGLYRLPFFKGYWGSASAVRGVAVRGYQGRQTLQHDLRPDGSIVPVRSWRECNGMIFDANVCCYDAIGDRAMVVSA
jgi:hypothetical protein